MLWEASGTIYPIDESKELCNLAYDLSMRTHMDGLRFACTVQTNQQASLVLPVEANKVFVPWSSSGFEGMERQLIQFQRWRGSDDHVLFVFAHSTNDRKTQASGHAMGQSNGSRDNDSQTLQSSENH